MRLQILEDGYRPLQKILLAGVRLVYGGPVPGPIRVMTYRRELFGKYLAAFGRDAMRGATTWSIGEVELFAAFVSRINECKY